MKLHYLGRALLIVAGLGAIIAFAGGWTDLRTAVPDRIWVEGWRTFGFGVFAALFFLLAWRPTRSPIVWEAVFLHKAAMVGLHMAVGDVPEAGMAAGVDVVLCVILLTAWGLTRGWRSWLRDG